MDPNIIIILEGIFQVRRNSVGSEQNDYGYIKPQICDIIALNANRWGLVCAGNVIERGLDSHYLCKDDRVMKMKDSNICICGYEEAHFFRVLFS